VICAYCLPKRKGVAAAAAAAALAELLLLPPAGLQWSGWLACWLAGLLVDDALGDM
jgi:hypothetical protein